MFKKCSNKQCSNPSRNAEGLLPATLEYFFADKNTNSGLQYKCKICKLAQDKEYYETNKAKLLPKFKEYRDSNKEKVALAKKLSYQKNSQHYIDNAQKWAEDNRDQKHETMKARYRVRMDTEPEFHLIANLRRRTRSALFGKIKTKTTKELIGCSPQELRAHLEKQFQPGMSWDNYGEWHIDHIRPVSSFNLLDVEEQKLCFGYQNLQPLWAKDNLKKGAKIDFSISRRNNF